MRASSRTACHCTRSSNTLPVLERTMAYTASTGGDDVWIVEVHERGYAPPPSRDTPIDCP